MTILWIGIKKYIFARTCVRMSLLTPWPRIIHVFAVPDSDMIIAIYLHYETLLEACFFCGRIDHLLGHCPNTPDERPFLMVDKYLDEGNLCPPTATYDENRFGPIPENVMLVFPHAK